MSSQIYLELEGDFGEVTRLPNGDYMIQYNGYPYGVPNFGEYRETFEEIEAYVTEHPEKLTIEEPPAPPTFAQKKEEKRSQIAYARYQAEIAGITVSGAHVRTDRDSQALITGAALAVSQGITQSINWKTTEGFVTLTGEQVLAIATAVRNHVQACFNREAELQPLIDAAEDQADLDEIVFTL